MCLWIASGSLTSNQLAITKKGLWRSHTLGWSDITEIRLHEKQSGAIELRADSHKLVIDFRTIAFEHLLCEIEDCTHLQSSRSSSQKVILPSPVKSAYRNVAREPNWPNSYIPVARLSSVIFVRSNSVKA